MTDVISLNERRKYPRVSDAIALRLDEQSSDSEIALDPTPTHIVKISCGGIRFLHNRPINEGSHLLLSVHLPSSDTTVQLSSKVIHSGEEKATVSGGSKLHVVQVEFQNLESSTRVLLKKHIDYVIEKAGVPNNTLHTAR